MHKQTITEHRQYEKNTHKKKKRHSRAAVFRVTGAEFFSDIIHSVVFTRGPITLYIVHILYGTIIYYIYMVFT